MLRGSHAAVLLQRVFLAVAPAQARSLGGVWGWLLARTRGQGSPEAAELSCVEGGDLEMA